MLSIFSKKNRCLGVDIGTTGIKIVELVKESNVPVFNNYAITYGSDSSIHSNGLEILEGQTGQILNLVFQEGKFGTKKAVLGIPGFLALISFIELPEMPKEEMDQAVRFEANKYIPTPLEDVSLGWEIIGGFQEKSVDGGQANKQGQRLQIMTVTVPKRAVEKISLVASSAGFKVAAMEVENFAAVRCLVGNDKGTFLIINMGSKSTDFTIVSDGVVRVSRSIDTGGAEISRAIANGLGIDLQRAEKIKRSKQINLLNSADRLFGFVSPSMGIVIDEIKRLREVFHKKNPLKKIEKIIFSGGGSKMETLLSYVSQQVSLECQLGNSLARIGVEKKYKEVIENIAPELTVAIGLALRGLDEK
jgi:type IV pilus assembly protein PilM